MPKKRENHKEMKNNMLNPLFNIRVAEIYWREVLFSFLNACLPEGKKNKLNKINKKNTMKQS